jgi:hypothetical protein
VEHPGEVTSTIGSSVEAVTGQPRIHLHYLRTRDGTAYDYPRAVVWTRPQYSARRWWWLCPLMQHGQPRARVGKRYRPPGARYFGCRHRYDLT